jgi:hypothetical protein
MRVARVDDLSATEPRSYRGSYLRSSSPQVVRLVAAEPPVIYAPITIGPCAGVIRPELRTRRALLAAAPTWAPLPGGRACGRPDTTIPPAASGSATRSKPSIRRLGEPWKPSCRHPPRSRRGDASRHLAARQRSRQAAFGNLPVRTVRCRSAPRPESGRRERSTWCREHLRRSHRV